APEESATAVEIASPAEAGDAATDVTDLATAILQPQGSRAERDRLVKLAAAIHATLDGTAWDQLRTLLAARMAAGDFWDDPKRHQVLARFALMDRVKAATETADSLMERYLRGTRGRAG